MVRDHRPLQQGLRQQSGDKSFKSECRVRDHRPLQQGLRPANDHNIELVNSMYETIVHYNKD